MGEPVKGQMRQILFPLVDDGDFATVLSAITESDFNSAATRRFYGVNNGTSAAFTSGAISKLGRLVHSGIFMLTLKGTENDYDHMTVVIQHPSAADQILQWDNREYDNSDLYSQLVAASNMLSNLSGLASDAHSAAAQANSRALVLQSNVSALSAFMSDAISDLQSDLRSVLLVTGVSLTSDTMSNLRSAITAAGGGAGATPSALWAYDYGLVTVASSMGSLMRKAASGVSDTYSLLDSRVPDITTTGSDLVSAIWAHAVASDLISKVSDLRSKVITMSDVLSNAYSGVQVLESALIGHTGSTASQVTDASTLEIDGITHDDQFNGYFVKILGGSQVDELRLVVDTILSTSKIVVKPAFLSRLQSGVDFVIVAGNPYFSNVHSDIKSAVAAGGGGATTSAIADKVWSDFQSKVGRTVSDAFSELFALSDAISDIRSVLLVTGVSLTSDTMSNLRSAITAAGGGAGATPSQVWAFGYSNLTVASSIGSLLRGRLSTISAVYSGISNLQSRVDSTVASRSQMSDLMSDLRSYLVGISGALSNVDSALTSQFAYVSNALSDFQSDMRSVLLTTGVSLTSDTMSNLRSAITAAGGGAGATPSALWAYDYGLVTVASSIGSLMRKAASGVSDTYSLLDSRVPDITTTGSDLVSAIWAHAVASDLISKVSDLRSHVITTGVPLDASTMSDLRSAITAAGGGTGATASQVWTYTAGTGRTLTASGISDIVSALRVELSSNLSDLLSRTTQINSRVSDLNSDLRSLITGASWMSDMASRVWAAKYTANSAASSFGSLLSDLYSRVALTQSMTSDVASALTSRFSDLLSLLTTTGVQLNASTMSDIRSSIGAVSVTLTASDISDIASAVWAHTVGARVDSRVLRALSDTSDLMSRTGTLGSDLSDLLSRTTQINSRVLAASDVLSDLYELLSDVESQLDATTATLSDFYSDFGSRVPGRILVRADTLSELTTVAPSTPTQEQALMQMFMRERNNTKITATKRLIRNAAGTTVASATINDNNNSFVQGTLG